MASFTPGDLPGSWSQASTQRDAACSLHTSEMNTESTENGIPLQYRGFSYSNESNSTLQPRRHYPDPTAMGLLGAYNNAAVSETDPYVSKFAAGTQWHMNGTANNMANSQQADNYRQFYDNRNGYQLPNSGLQDPNMQVQLCDKELWEQFSNVGTEMIVTKTGRRMFPGYRIKISGLDKDASYCVMMDIVNVDDHRYKFQHGEWTIAGRGEPHLPQRFFLHPDSPAIGAKWMSEVVSFHKVKLTNSIGRDVDGKIVLNSMHRYQPRIHIVRTNDTSTVHLQRLCTFAFPQTVFITVTAYQNPEVTKLKIDHNPFAKGFREDGARAKKPRSTQSFEHFMNQNGHDQYGYCAGHYSHTPVVTVSPDSNRTHELMNHHRQLHPYSRNQGPYVPGFLDEAPLHFQGQSRSSEMDVAENWIEQ